MLRVCISGGLLTFRSSIQAQDNNKLKKINASLICYRFIRIFLILSKSIAITMAEVNPAFERLEAQLSWYDTKSMWNQKWYKRLKVAEIIAAAIIPFAAGFEGLGILTGILGVLIVIFIGIQSLNQYHDNWISYRSTAEQLKHEKYLKSRTV